MISTTCQHIHSEPNYPSECSRVVVWADRDAPGYRCAADRLSSLLGAGLAAEARLPRPKHQGADVRDTDPVYHWR